MYKRSIRRFLPWLVPTLSVFAVAVVFWQLMPRVTFQPHGDHTAHHWIARSIWLEPRMNPYPVYHFLLIAIKVVFSIGSFRIAGEIASTVAIATTGAFIFITLVQQRDAFRGHVGWIVTAGILTPILLIVWPIPLPMFYDAERYFSLGRGDVYAGYLAPNSFHNPTMLTLKAMSVPLCWIVMDEKRLRSSFLTAGSTWLAAALIVLSALAKPNFVICVLPAMAVWSGLLLIRKKRVNWIYLLGGILLPGMAILAWQYHSLFGLSTKAVSIAPFAVVSAQSIDVFQKFLLSLLFPMVIVLMFPRRAMSETGLRLAWLLFAFGCLYHYTFLEANDRWWHGNFRWSAEMGIFVLFLYSTAFLLKRTIEGGFQSAGTAARIALTWVVFGLHAVAGLIAYGLHYTQRTGA